MRKHPKHARVNPRSPRAWGTSDRSGFITNHERLQMQREWAGFGLIDLNLLVHPSELDRPQRQLGALILPPDPPSIANARPEQYYFEEQIWRLQEDGQHRQTQSGQLRLLCNAQGTAALYQSTFSP